MLLLIKRNWNRIELQRFNVWCFDSYSISLSFCIDWCCRKLFHSVSYFTTKYSDTFSTLYSSFFVQYFHEIQFLSIIESFLSWMLVGWLILLLVNNEKRSHRKQVGWRNHQNKNNWANPLITLLSLGKITFYA